MALIKLSAIVLLALVCHAVAIDVRCWSRNRHWCAILDAVPTITDNDKITLTNTEPKQTVTHFRWTWPIAVKTMPKVWFETFPNIEVCDITGMGVETMTQTTFESAGHLKKLIMDKNRIRVVPNAVWKWASNLTDIDLDNNEIVELQDWCLTGLTKLKSLHLSNNHIKTLTTNTLAGAPKLETLHLTNNEIETIEDGALALPHLKTLHLGMNHIKTMPINVLTGAPLLNHLDLANNMLTEIPAALLHKHKIITLILDLNPLDNVHIKDIMTIPSIEILWLEDTGVITTWTTVDIPITNASMINHLDLTNNGIRTPTILQDLRLLTQLNTVILDENLMDHLDVEDIKSVLPALTTVHMENTEVNCDWLQTILPTMTAINVEIKTGEIDADVGVAEQRTSVDNEHVCGKLI